MGVSLINQYQPILCLAILQTNIQNSDLDKL